MSTYTLIKQTNENYLVVGELTFFSLNKETRKSFDFLKSEKKICINLEKINSADSAGLALIIEWIKYSNLYGTELAFKHIPRQILTLSKLSNFDLTTYMLTD